jgi:oligoendopeptidase F
MTLASLPTRSEVDPKYTWNAESLFATPAVWDAELDALLTNIPTVKAYQGRLHEGPEVLADALKAVEQIMVRGYRIFVYAGFSYAVDTTNQQAAAMQAKAQGSLDRWQRRHPSSRQKSLVWVKKPPWAGSRAKRAWLCTNIM